MKPLYSKSFLQSTSTSLLIINSLHSRVAHRSFDWYEIDLPRLHVPSMEGIAKTQPDTHKSSPPVLAAANTDALMGLPFYRLVMYVLTRMNINGGYLPKPKHSTSSNVLVKFGSLHRR